MTQFSYRLQLLLERKEEAKKEAERELTQQEEQLQAQLELLQSLQCGEKELTNKRDQLRRELLTKPAEGGALTSRDVLDRSEYVKVVGLQIENVKSDILSQRLVVEQCQMRVKEATNRVEETRREVEVLTKHRAKQRERFLRELQAKEELALDEIGNVMFTTRRRPI